MIWRERRSRKSLTNARRISSRPVWRWLRQSILTCLSRVQVVQSISVSCTRSWLSQVLTLRILRKSQPWSLSKMCSRTSSSTTTWTKKTSTSPQGSSRLELLVDITHLVRTSFPRTRRKRMTVQLGVGAVRVNFLLHSRNRSLSVMSLNPSSGLSRKASDSKTLKALRWKTSQMKHQLKVPLIH